MEEGRGEEGGAEAGDHQVSCQCSSESRSDSDTDHQVLLTSDHQVVMITPP